MSLATTVGGDIQVYDDGEMEVNHETEIVLPSSLGAMVRSEIEAQVATARRYPRKIKTFLDRSIQQVTAMPVIAKKCMYALERWDAKEGKKKIIDGPSIRMAEIMASAYGNLRTQARVIGMDDRFVTVEGNCLDTENNVGFSQEIKRRITTSKGKTYNEDMIMVTANAAMSIALRNAIFRVIPVAYRDIIYAEAKRVAVGGAAGFISQRDEVLGFFADHDIPLADVLDACGAASVDDMTADHICALIGIQNSINDGTTTLARVFAKPEPVQPTKSKSAGLASKLKTEAPEPGSDG